MKDKLTLEQAKKLIMLARDSISAFLEGKDFAVDNSIKNEFKDKRGCFVSLYVNNELNGCIGFPEPTAPLWRAVKESAISAAFEDPRFPALTKEQFDMKEKMKIELSVLTIPQLIEVNTPAEYPDKIKIGKDGLIIRNGYRAGLLLPQVAIEYKWGTKQFLEETCKKAGLSPSCLMDKQTKVYKFQAQIFSEENSILVEKKL